MKKTIEIPTKDLEHLLCWDKDCQRCAHEDHYDEEDEACPIHEKYMKLLENKP